MNLLSVTTHRNGYAPCEQQMERSDSGEVVEGACESSNSLTKSRGSLKTATVCISENSPLLQLLLGLSICWSLKHCIFHATKYFSTSQAIWPAQQCSSHGSRCSKFQTCSCKTQSHPWPCQAWCSPSRRSGSL